MRTKTPIGSVQFCNRCSTVLQQANGRTKLDGEARTNGRLGLTVRGIEISYGDPMKIETASGVKQVPCFTFNGRTCPAPPVNGKVKL